jgi:hypothetical protein
LLQNCEVLEKPYANKRQLDLLFLNHQSQTINYFEIKTNIDSDAEKLDAVAQKIAEVEKHFKASTYLNYTFQSGILCPTNVSDSGLTYSKAKLPIFSLRDFINCLNIGITEQELAEMVELIRLQIATKLPTSP